VKRLGDDAGRVLAGAGVPGIEELAAVTAVWRECVGDAIARSAWPQRLARDRTLYVATVSSTWAFELERLGGDIAGRLQSALGEGAPAGLRFAPGPVPEPAAPSTPEPTAPVDVPPETRAEADGLAAAIEDDELRGLVARAAAASLARARSGRRFC
jgi:hypothetical protein